ncbi:MAG: ankyrin repeat domain-containing protein [SAR324 cluster bacterium]|nr:ankyrin repeat domain-containing protein [SAR324 cluster bacterium]
MLNRITRGYKEQTCVFRTHEELVKGNVSSGITKIFDELQSRQTRKVIFDFKATTKLTPETIEFIQGLSELLLPANISVYAVHGSDVLVKTLPAFLLWFASLKDAISGNSFQSKTQEPSSVLNKGFFSNTMQQAKKKKSPQFSISPETEYTPQSESDLQIPTVTEPSIFSRSLKSIKGWFHKISKHPKFNIAAFQAGIVALIAVFGWSGYLGYQWWFWDQVVSALEHNNQAYFSNDFNQFHGSDAGGRTALMLAIKLQKPEIALSLSEKSDLNAMDLQGRTALMYAAYQGNHEVIKAVTDGGSEINTRDNSGKSSLMWAMERNQYSAVLQLLEQGADPVLTKAQWDDFFKTQEPEIKKKLRQALAEAREKHNLSMDQWMALAGNRKVENMQRFLDAGLDINTPDKQGQTLFMKAVSKDNRELIEALFDQNADCNLTDSRGETALSWAVFQGYDAVTRLLLNRKADPNKGSMPPLMWASFHGKLPMIELLIQHGAQVNVTNPEGWTPLMLAVSQGHVNAVWTLLTHGAKIDAANNMGYQPLMIAANKGHSDISRLLVAKGASVTAQTREGKTAMDLAIENGYGDIARHLQQTKMLLQHN